ncbi:centromere/kinetochore protein zw10 homolog [Orussus abietinus]|uniref:centromere/kinetochore protein zw10 homolog n=1 Tax=Orussus abietinus TaxID=222816 RepID=UPI00062617EF|nr:centromere/kinetochore protein zw10 homolog [Orussus abietinus]
MTSFLTNVLVTAEEMEKVDLNEKVTQIQKEILKLKCNIKEFMADKYVEFLPKLSNDKKLVSRAEKLLAELQTLRKRVDDQIKIHLYGSTRELKKLSNALKESDINLKLTRELLELNEYFRSIEQYKENKRYIDVAETLKKMLTLLNDSESDLQHLDIYSSLKNNYSRLYGIFKADTSFLLQEYICFKEKEEEDKGTVASLHFDSNVTQVSELIQALYYVDLLVTYLQKFSIKLMKHLIQPIIRYKCDVRVIDEKTFIVQTLNKSEKPVYKSVLYNLTLLFKFLNQHINVVLDDKNTFISRLHAFMFQEFSEILIQDCISNTIPSSSIELESFAEVVQDIEEFQDCLIQIGFISNDERFLTKYTINIDKLYVDKRCQDLLAKARTIMKKDLHDSIKYELQMPSKISENHLEDDSELYQKLSSATFHSPVYHISKSAKELLDLTKDILDEACRSKDDSAQRLFYTSRNVFEMYAILVPQYHKKFLDTIPQQVALFHNNCMFLAHHLLTLAHEYRDKLPKILLKHNITYADQTTLLRKIGSQCFLEHMLYQRNIIIDILRESGLSTLGQVSKLLANTERALRQCIRQLELLRTVWLEVLPTNIYCRAVGCIMNTMIEDLIMKVVSAEDIPVDVATELVTLFNMLLDRGPSIFPDPKTIEHHVRKWRKLTELIKVLEASLKEIQDRWADGKGPLAEAFNAQQVKQLIRALFQNTERRAALLSTIK